MCEEIRAEDTLKPTLLRRSTDCFWHICGTLACRFLGGVASWRGKLQVCKTQPPIYQNITCHPTTHNLSSDVHAPEWHDNACKVSGLCATYVKASRMSYVVFAVTAL